MDGFHVRRMEWDGLPDDDGDKVKPQLLRVEAECRDESLRDLDGY